MAIFFNKKGLVFQKIRFPNLSNREKKPLSSSYMSEKAAKSSHHSHILGKVVTKRRESF
jgi:hypothetical protein